MKKYWWSSGSGRIELNIPEEVVRTCAHPGDCGPDVAKGIVHKELQDQLYNIDPDLLVQELKEYFCDSTPEEFLDRHLCLMRLLWVACNDIAEANDIPFNYIYHG